MKSSKWLKTPVDCVVSQERDAVVAASASKGAALGSRSSGIPVSS
jgi:hypothetical protein